MSNIDVYLGGDCGAILYCRADGAVSQHIPFDLAIDQFLHTKRDALTNLRLFVNNMALSEARAVVVSNPTIFLLSIGVEPNSKANSKVTPRVASPTDS